MSGQWDQSWGDWALARAWRGPGAGLARAPLTGRDFRGIRGKTSGFRVVSREGDCLCGGSAHLHHAHCLLSCLYHVPCPCPSPLPPVVRMGARCPRGRRCRGSGRTRRAGQACGRCRGRRPGGVAGNAGGRGVTGNAGNTGASGVAGNAGGRPPGRSMLEVFSGSERLTRAAAQCGFRTLPPVDRLRGWELGWSALNLTHL